MNTVADPQLRLGLLKPIRSVDVALVVSQPSLLSAVKLCIALGGFTTDKQLYLDLEIDAGHWTRVMRGEAHFPIDKLGLLMDLCGNEAPLIWLLHSRGYDVASLRKRETETERELRQAREDLARERLKNEALREAFRSAA